MLIDEALEQGTPPVLAILRGIRPVEVADVGSSLIQAGIRLIEVPLNSPNPFASIDVLVSRFADAVIGAGTVTTVDQIDELSRRGASLVVMPHVDETLIRRALHLGLEPMPGFATPTEAFRAHAAGARILKLFPATTFGWTYLKALLEVLPPAIRVWSVGGISSDNAAQALAAGAAGLGAGSSLYKSGDDPESVAQKAQKLLRSIR